MVKLILTVALIFSFYFAFTQTAEKTVIFEDCSAEKFKENLEKISGNSILIDIRPLKDYKRGRIEGAIQIEEISLIFGLLNKYSKDKPIFLYSETGDESITVAALLMRNGYNKIYNLREGIEDWWRAGFKLDKSKIKTNLVCL
jgi:rhodanese-related sulfurtransferase